MYDDINNNKNHIEKLYDNIILSKNDNILINNKINENINENYISLNNKILMFQQTNEFKLKESINESSNLNDIVSEIQDGLLINMNNIEKTIKNI